MGKQFSLSGSSSHSPLIDTEQDVKGTLCTVENLPFYQKVLLNEKSSPIYSAMVKFGVLFACVPKSLLFKEFVHWLVFALYHGKCFVMNYLGESVLQVTAQLIRQALCYLKSESYVNFTEESLVALYDNLAGQEFTQVVFFLKLEAGHLSPDDKEFPLEIFDAEVKSVVQFMSKILGKEDVA